VTRSQADMALNEAMQVCQVNRLTRWIIYSGVRLGGWVIWKKYHPTKETP
jgi:hypothetical protein